MGLSESDRIERLERLVAAQSRQLAGIPVRWADTGGGGSGSETLGCYLTRSGGALTINLSALFAEGYEVDDTDPCPKVVTGGGGIGLPDPPDNSVLVFNVTGTTTGKAWQANRTLVRGYCNDHVYPTDLTFGITVTDNLAGGLNPGASLNVRKNLGVGNSWLRRAYSKDTLIYAIWNNTDVAWDDITPAEGQWLTCFTRAAIPAASWNSVGHVLTPAVFETHWLVRPTGVPGQTMYEAGIVAAENRSLDGVADPGVGKGILHSLVYSEGVFTLPFAVDCPTFTY